MKRFSVILIFCSALICMLPAVSSHFIFDDSVFIEHRENLYKSESLKLYFNSNVLGDDFGHYYRPMHFLSLFLNRALFGHNALAYHLVNLALHAAVSLALYFLLSFFFGYGLRSLFASVIFAVHPVHVDTVAFIHNRSDILALLFLLMAFLMLASCSFWRNYFLLKPVDLLNQTSKNFYSAVAAACFMFLAFLSKETAVITIIILFLFAVLRAYRLGEYPDRNIIKAFAVFASVFFLYLLLRFVVLGSFSAPPSEIGVFKEKGFSVIFPTMSRIFAEYVLLLLAPFSLKVSYIPYQISRHFFEGKAVLSYVFHMTILGCAFFVVMKKPFISFVLFAFYISLLPVSHLVPFYDLKAERFLYIPSVFFCLLVTYPLGLIKPDSRHYRAVILLFTALTLIWASLSFRYSTFFASPRLLWDEMIRRKPDSALFNSNMGLHLFYHEKDYEGAVSYLESANDLNPRYGNYLSLGMAYDFMGEDEKAREAFLNGLELKPEDLDLNLNYAIFNCLNGDFNIARPFLKKALKIDPSNSQAILYLEEVERRLKVKGR